MGVLEGLHARGRTIVIVTHDEHVASNAKRIVKISDGRIVSDAKSKRHI